MTVAPAVQLGATGAPRPRLSVGGLSKAFGERKALEDVSFTVKPSEIFGLLGPNGAGKTTAFRLLSGLLPPDRGTFTLDGELATAASSSYRVRLGVVFQEPSLDLKLTGRENLALGAALYGVPRGLAKQRIRDVLELMQLGPRADEPAARYSGGMRRRIEIARVLLHDPRLLLMDEPGRGVDPEALRRIWDEIASLCANRGLSVILTTHQPEEAERCHRIAILDQGRLVAVGTPDELRARVAGDVVRVEADRPEEIAAAITERLGLSPRIVDARVCVEAPHGHELVPRIVELFAAGRLRSVATARPTLADVFAKVTGRGLHTEIAPS
jgi:ABC-2 type transport system ATP-binding protein